MLKIPDNAIIANITTYNGRYNFISKNKEIISLYRKI